MDSKTYSVRVSDPLLNAEIAAYAAAHRVPESVALVRLLNEGRNAREGKPIARFAALDPQAITHYSVALGELRDLSRALRHCVTALRVPRPVSAADQVAWEAEKKKAMEIFDAVTRAINALKRAGRLGVLLNDFEPWMLDDLYRQGIERRIRPLAVIFGALLGKPVDGESPKPATAA